MPDRQPAKGPLLFNTGSDLSAASVPHQGEGVYKNGTRGLTERHVLAPVSAAQPAPGSCSGGTVVSTPLHSGGQILPRSSSRLG